MSLRISVSDNNEAEAGCNLAPDVDPSKGASETAIQNADDEMTTSTHTLHASFRAILTGIGWKVVLRFGEFFPCCCLPFLPGLACRIHKTWGLPLPSPVYDIHIEVVQMHGFCTLHQSQVWMSSMDILFPKLAAQIGPVFLPLGSLCHYPRLTVWMLLVLLYNCCLVFLGLAILSRVYLDLEFI